MEGIWVISQDGNSLIYVKTFEIWQGGRIVARFGKDWKLLGDYNNQEEAREVLGKLCKFITTRTTETFKMSQRKTIEGEVN